jgi:protoporphyrinogen oxidase
LDGYDKISQDNFLRDIFAFPDQTKVPESFTSGLKSFYPNKVGIDIFIESIRDYLEAQGVRILEGTNVSLSDKDSSNIELLNIGDEQIKVEEVIWTAGLIPLAGFLGNKVDFTSMDHPRSTIVVNLAFEKMLNSNKNYYQYNLDPSNDFYRVTLYQNFTQESTKNYKVTIEMITDYCSQTDQYYVTAALEGLKQMTLIDASHKLSFSAVETLPYGFPRPSIKNKLAFDKIRIECEGQYGNLLNLGLNSKEGLFFYRDILKDVFTRILG